MIAKRKDSRRKKLYKAGRLAERAGVSRQAIHNYTVMGLIREAERTEGGHRLYDERALRRVRLIERMKRDYPLAEILRTFKRGFTAILFAFALSATAARAAVPASGVGEVPAAGEGRFTAEEHREIHALFTKLGRAMEEGDADAVLALVSGRLRGRKREELARALAAEFDEYVYALEESDEYRIRYDLEADGNRREDGSVEIAAVHIRAPYSSRRKGIDPTTDTFDRSFTFLLVREDGAWRFGPGRFWQEFHHNTARHVLGWIIFGSLVGLLAVTVWLWMLFDCTFRSVRRGRAAWLTAGLMPVPVGLAVGVALGALRGGGAALAVAVVLSIAYMVAVRIPARRAEEG